MAAAVALQSRRMFDERAATEEFERRIEAVVVRAERSALRAAMGLGEAADATDGPEARDERDQRDERDAPNARNTSAGEIMPPRAQRAALPPLPPSPPPAEGSRGHALQAALGLSRAELELVWSVVARAVDPRVSGHARVVFGSEARLGASLAQHIAWHELAPAESRALLGVLDPRHPLVSAGLLVPVGGAPHDVCTPWTVVPRLVAFLRGDDSLDPAIDAVGGLVEIPPSGRHSAEQLEAMDTLHGWLTSVEQATIVVEGPHGAGRRTAVALAAAPRPVLAVDFARVAPRRAAELLAAMRREVLLRGALPLLANLDELWARLPPGEETALALGGALELLGDLVVVTTSTPALELGTERRTLLRARWPVPDAITRHSLWSDVLGELDASAELDVVAHRYALGAGGIAAAARSAHHHAQRHGRARPAFADLVDGLQDNIAERLGELARRVEIRQAWSELVLPPDTLEDVTALISRIRHSHFVLDHWNFRRKLARGAGVAALFSGPPGTGKTMVAGLIARELSLELYQVDLSRIVSKWVGETEKQLARVFEAAEAGHALLLFDEADALFAKRSARLPRPQP
jgi:hypothetical protein